MTIYLYKKTHKVTGLQYLGKTVRDPFKYNGSAFSTTVITGSSGSITLDPMDLIDVVVHFHRPEGRFAVSEVWFRHAEVAA